MKTCIFNEFMIYRQTDLRGRVGMDLSCAGMVGDRSEIMSSCRSLVSWQSPPTSSTWHQTGSSSWDY